jgi:hypothetical protein
MSPSKKEGEGKSNKFTQPYRHEAIKPPTQEADPTIDDSEN